RRPASATSAGKDHALVPPPSEMSAIALDFCAGTLEIRGLPQPPPEGLSHLVWDDRVGCHRLPALAYADLVLRLRALGLPCQDRARRYSELTEPVRIWREPRPFQREALQAWLGQRGRGVVVLPTGAGKTHVAVMAIAHKRRSTLVVAPTLDLVRQWYDLLRTTFACPVGLVGGGEHDVQPLTVTTYESAYLHMEHLGNRFGLVVFDECHHLPGAAYALAARMCLAPFRLGLTATPERSDGREADLDELIGPVVYRRDIHELSGHYLAEYETVRLVVELTPDERREYEQERALYRAFLDRHGIRISGPQGWTEFILRASRSAEGRRALAAYRRQRELAFAAPAKLDVVAELLHRHRADRCLLFTQDNATAYAVSRRFLVPAITHQTRVRERSEILARFAQGTYGAVVTSRVLNEGIDVPEANMAVVISGSGSVREHVQRLGRILRKREGKRAVLYEIVSAHTTEAYTSERRRDHVAYR
ncbi:MAG: DEAD/DEAH box helicase family protein, partial [Myxococcales bacterium]|nr:DEAD/DEAH box helicase family protein [Myxococcales bacterium]